MGQHNRNLAAKAARAAREAAICAADARVTDDLRPVHYQLAAPRMIREHFNLEPARVSDDERARLVGDFLSRRRITKCRAGKYKPEQSSVQRGYVSRTLTAKKRDIEAARLTLLLCSLANKAKAQGVTIG